MRQETADRMLWLFNEHGWWQSGQSSACGECLRTAVFIAAETSEEEAATLRDLVVQIRRRHPRRVAREDDPGIEVAKFNDHPATTRRAIGSVVQGAVTRTR